jgi:hypothetical protein
VVIGINLLFCGYRDLFTVVFQQNIAKYLSLLWNIPGHAVAQLVEALRYKPDGRGLYSRWYHWIFSLTESFLPHCGPHM